MKTKTYKIDKHVPVPEPNIAANTIRSMKLGDSIFFEDRGDATRFAQSMYQAGQGKKFVQLMHKVDGGWRVWKIAKEAVPKTTLTELAARLEAAQSPDPDIDGAIHYLLCAENFPEERGNPVLDYTSSLDAAVALVEKVMPGCAFEIRKRLNGTCAAIVQKRDLVGIGLEYYEDVDGVTTTLALCLALVRALIDKEKL